MSLAILSPLPREEGRLAGRLGRMTRLLALVALLTLVAVSLAAVASAADPSRADIQPIVITKYVDKSSTVLAP